jgi:hypothetical protein
MGPETKAQAQDKLAKFTVKIGYPVMWRDYAKLELKPNDLYGNALKAAFNQWFAERERVNAGDRLALDLLDGALLHDGAVGTQKAERSRLQHVGLMPGGRNYLEGCLFTSAWYGGLDDEFNRNYLAHLESDIAHLVDKEKKYKIF